MSECAGENCTHPDCVDRRDRHMDRLREIPPEKLQVMNRAERRAAMKGKRL